MACGDKGKEHETNILCSFAQPSKKLLGNTPGLLAFNGGIQWITLIRTA